MSEIAEIKITEAIENRIDRSKWVKWKFSDLVINIVEKVVPKDSGLEYYIGLKDLDTGSLKIRRFGETKSLIGDKLKIYKGDLIFAKRNSYLKRVAIADFDAVASAHSLVLRPNTENVNPDFLPFFMMSELFWKRAIEISVGSLSPTINWKALAKQEFLLPPKSQQKQLAELLWAMDEVIEKEKKVLENNILLKEVIYRDSTDYGYSSKSKQLPKGWRIKKIKEFAKVQAGSTPLRATKAYFENGTTPWVKTLDLNNAEIHSTEESITQLAVIKTSCKPKPINSVLVAMYGGFNQIGRTGILKVEASTNQAVSAIMVDENIINPTFLLIVLNANISYWKKVAISSRKDPNITKNDVENFPVPIPELKIQNSIIDKVNLVLDCIKDSKLKIASSKALQKSLINQIF